MTSNQFSANMDTLISVIVCTYNPNLQYLSRVLEGLEKQTLDFKKWELLIIDNNSLTQVQDLIDISWHPNAKVLVESQPGQLNARVRGIAETKSPIILFLDDDNVVNSDYLQEVVKISDGYPCLGAWGSAKILPDYDMPEPPVWIKKYSYYLAIVDAPKDFWGNNPEQPRPHGAGLCIRREVANAYKLNLENDSIDFRKNLGRKGNSLTAHDDHDIDLFAIHMKFGIGIFRSLVMQHIIPPKRLDEEYFTRLIESISYSNTLLNSYWQRKGVLTKPARPNGFFARALRKSRRLIRQAIQIGELYLDTKLDQRFARAARAGRKRARIESQTWKIQ